MNPPAKEISRPARVHLTPLKVVFYYVLVAGVWILFSDKLLQFMVRDTAQLTFWEIAKGWLFVLVSALLLYGLIRHHLRAIQRREALLRISEERFRSVFENAATGMILLSPAKEILQANPAFCHFLGFGAEELQGKTLDELTHPADRERREWAFRDCSPAAPGPMPMRGAT